MRAILPATLIVLCLCLLPATAALLEVTVSGTVSGYDRANHTVTIANPARYGCSYPPGEEKNCSFTPMDVAALTGTIPSDSTMAVIHPGDPVVATSIGGAGERWIALAALAGPTDSRTVVDIVGEPSAIPLPLAGDYSLDLITNPDCTACSGTICTAQTSYVGILDHKVLRDSGNLTLNATSTYSARNDGSSITVTFEKGQAPSSACAGRDGMMTGPQPVSVYIVHVVPPIGSAVQPPGTTSSVPSTTPPEVTMPAEARPTTAKSGMLPFAAMGALAFVAAAGILRR